MAVSGPSPPTFSINTPARSHLMLIGTYPPHIIELGWLKDLALHMRVVTCVDVLILALVGLVVADGLLGLVGIRHGRLSQPRVISLITVLVVCALAHGDVCYGEILSASSIIVHKVKVLVH